MNLRPESRAEIDSKTNVPMRFLIPIGWKLSSLFLVIILVCSVPIIWRATALFLENSVDREWDHNLALARIESDAVNDLLRSSLDKMMMIGGLRLQEFTANATKSSNSASEFILKNEKKILSFSLIRMGADGRQEYLSSYQNVNLMQRFKVSSEELLLLNQNVPMPLDQVFAGQSILHSRPLGPGLHVLSMAVPMAKDSFGRVSHVVLADFDSSLMSIHYNQEAGRAVFLVDRDGFILAHPNQKLVMERASASALPVFREAMASKATSGKIHYQMPNNKEFVILAYAKSMFDLVVVSEASDSLISEPIGMIKRQLYYVLAIVMSFSLSLIFLFSRALTRPIKHLAHIVSQIGQGRFNVNAARAVKSKDELEMLAAAVDGMIGSLRERDKIKNLVSKFNGDVVPGPVTKSGAMNLTGVRRQSVVFFSEIRDFTKLSENLSAEEVLSILNEYFSVMIEIVERNGGVVDKFIGDVMIAIWGVSTPSHDDAFMAIKACLEIREGLLELNKIRLSRGEEPLRVGMGLHAGDVTSGGIGAKNRTEFIVFGDAISDAFRIGATSKALGTDLLVSQDVARLVQGRVLLTEAGEFQAKGKTVAQRIYKARGFIESDGGLREIKTPFSEYEVDELEARRFFAQSPTTP